MKLASFILFAVLVMATIAPARSQSRSYRIYDDYSGRDGFTFLSFSKAMIDAVHLDLDDPKKKVTGDLMEIRILVADHDKIKEGDDPGSSLSRRFDHFNYKKLNLEEKEGNKNVEFWIEGTESRVKECHIIVRNSDDQRFACMVSFYGNFKVDDLERFEKFSLNQAKKEE